MELGPFVVGVLVCPVALLVGGIGWLFMSLGQKERTVGDATRLWHPSYRRELLQTGLEAMKVDMTRGWLRSLFLGGLVGVPVWLLVGGILDKEVVKLPPPPTKAQSCVDIRITFEARTDSLPPGETWDSAKKQATSEVLSSRLQAIGSPPRLAQQGRVFVVDVSSTRDLSTVLTYLTALGQLEFRHLYNVHFSSASRWRPAAGKYTMTTEPNLKTGRGDYLFFDVDGKDVKNEVVLEESRLILSGDDLKPISKVSKDPQSSNTVVLLKFTPQGRQKFADFTRSNVNEILAIALDGKILSAPSIDQPILNGSAVITGSFNQEEAQDLAHLLNIGPLPAPLDVVKVERK